MRYVIYGAGAIGGAIGGRLAQAGYDVALLARGPHGDALARRGLELRWPGGEELVTTVVAAHPAELAWGPDDVAILAMKSYDTVAALEALVAASGSDLPVFCAQNGVDNERMALRHFTDVYAVNVVLAASHLAPGVVQLQSYPMAGILDVGRYPSGTDARADTVSADLVAAGFSSLSDPAVMRRKYRKLLANLGNALDAAAGGDGRASDLFQRARIEAEACFAAAGIDYLSAEEENERRAVLSERGPVSWKDVRSSSWQSLARGTGRIEADYLNGEVVLLGRLHHVDTPVNAMLQRVANRLAASHSPPSSMTLADLEAELERA